jgi:hypothetical protein
MAVGAGVARGIGLGGDKLSGDDVGWLVVATCGPCNIAVTLKNRPKASPIPKMLSTSRLASRYWSTLAGGSSSWHVVGSNVTECVGSVSFCNWGGKAGVLRIPPSTHQDFGYRGSHVEPSRH